MSTKRSRDRFEFVTVRRFSFDDFKDTDTIAAAQRRNNELTFEERDFLRDHAQLIDKIGAKSGGGPVEIKHGDATIADISVSGVVNRLLARSKRPILLTDAFSPRPKMTIRCMLPSLGWTFVNTLFPHGDAVGSEITIRGNPL